ncbi:hypothetical protein CPAV1605_828 [seawater metagenome]|uniref:Uncharacterized protein n=1 Tax=seawater metagenome TaxID=1561972 RepID=A0A5E8CI89_9ZZZZ
MDMDNRFWPFGCPAKMADGRFTTNYQNARVFNDKIKDLNNIKSSCDYRRFLQNNGQQLINNENKYLEQCWACEVRCCGQIPISCDKKNKGCQARKPCHKKCPNGGVLDGYQKFKGNKMVCQK